METIRGRGQRGAACVWGGVMYCGVDVMCDVLGVDVMCDLVCVGRHDGV